MSSKGIATPIPAATILMLRNGPGGLETFMVVRHHQIDFASGALVFPGGKLADGDKVVRDLAIGGEAMDDVQFAMRVGAIREAFEECGILLACERGNTGLISGSRLAELEPYRDLLNKDEIDLRTFLERERLQLRLDALQHFAHWITPEFMPKRFDTHFYLAEAPADHLAVHDGGESVDSIWIRPADALAESAAGKRTIIFPTRVNVALLGESGTVAEAMESARQRKIVKVLPWTEKRADGLYLCIPTDANYSMTEERMDGAPA